MGAPESSNIYGVQLRESADDGSDFSNAAADYRVLFLGEDGDLHLKDSSGTVTDVGGTGGSGQGLVDFAFTNYTAGDVTCDADDVWEDMPVADLVLDASTGDVVEVGLSLVCPNATAVSLGFDAHTIVAASPVNSVATGSAVDDANDGVAGWRLSASVAGNSSGSVFYTLQAGDISGGTVTLRLRDHPASSTNRVVSATTALPIQFWAKNLGPAM